MNLKIYFLVVLIVFFSLITSLLINALCTLLAEDEVYLGGAIGVFTWLIPVYVTFCIVWTYWGFY